jgi:hypothetical protein
MAIVPTRTQELVNWYADRAQVWQAQPTSIGLSASQATSFVNMSLLLADKFANQRAAELAARNATQELNDTKRDARRLASDLIAVIKGFAVNQPKPNDIYILAELPVPSTPAPLPPPGRPFDMTVGINPTSGAIQIKWKVSNPAGAAGTTYIVRRRVGGTGEFGFVGVTGTKDFTDTTFNAGPDSVQYTVQGQRSTQAGPLSDILTINFGRGLGRSGAENFSVEGGTKQEHVQPQNGEGDRKAVA